MANRPTFLCAAGACTCAFAAIIALTALTTPTPVTAQVTDEEKPVVLVTSSDQRRAYLAKATLWQERTLPTPN